MTILEQTSGTFIERFLLSEILERNILLLIGYLVIKSNFMPKIIGILVILAGMGYLIDNTAEVLLSNYNDYATIFLLIVAVPGVIGELSFAIWLLAKGKKIPEILPAQSSYEGRVTL